MDLRELTLLSGVSGDEDDIRENIKKEAEALADEITVDALGNLIVLKKGKQSGIKVMLAAHMDEVGFIVTGYNENGTLRFSAVGGIDDRILPGKRVLVGKNKLPGVIAAKPVNLIEKEEANKAVKIKNLYIDIGADKKEDAEKLVQPGEYISFTGEYLEMGNCIKSKALDDRVGCAILLEVLNNDYAFDLYCCFTVQEEVGLRGAEAAAYRIAPDLAFVIEGTTCSDVPGVEEYEYLTELGKGPAITVIDRASYPDRKLVEFICNTAKGNNIPFQFKKGATGGNDAGKIQISRSGVKVASISVPLRYIHSPVTIMNRNDFEHCIRLVDAVLLELSGNTIKLKELLDGGIRI